MNRNRKKMNKRTAFTAASCALLGIAAIGGTMAYLTDSETTTNTFTVGKVTVDLEEPNYPGNGSDEVKDLVPNEEVKKDPQVENTGKNNLVSFLKVYSPVSLISTVNDDGTKKEELGLHEIFLMKSKDKGISVHENSFRTSTAEHTGDDAADFEKDGWVELANKEVAETGKPYYQAKTDPDGTIRYNPVTDAEALAAIRGARFYRLDETTAQIVNATTGAVEPNPTPAYIPIDHETAKSGKFDVYVSDWATPATFTKVASTTDFTGEVPSAIQQRIDDARIYKAYVFGHDVEVKPNETTSPIFDKVQLKNVIEGEIDTQEQNIVIETYAIQSENIITALAGTDLQKNADGTLITSGTMNGTTLGVIYDTFVAQGTAGMGDEAAYKDGKGDLQKNVESHDANATLNKDLIAGQIGEGNRRAIEIHIDDAMLASGDTTAYSIITKYNNEEINLGEHTTANTMTLTSSNPNVVKINGGASASGAKDSFTITGGAVGTSVLTAEWDGAKATVEVTVVSKKGYKIAIANPTTTHLDKSNGETVTLSATKSGQAPDAAEGNVRWESSNTAVATVAANGNTCRVTPVKQGTAKITAYSVVGGEDVALDSVVITVDD